MNLITPGLDAAQPFAAYLFISLAAGMLSVFWLMIVFVVVIVSGIYLMYLYGRPMRRYEGRESVSWIYDEWSEDQILEHYWGGHLHAGFYGHPPVKKSFIQAKNDLVDAMFAWAMPETEGDWAAQLENGTDDPVRILDVGCGLGATMRHLGKRCPETTRITGITLSAGQARRGAALSREADLHGLSFLQGDALFQTFPDNCFDIVWSLECEPHIHDKHRFAQEMIRILKPGGLLIMGTWNLRDTEGSPLDQTEEAHLAFLLDEWNHAAFVSVKEWNLLFEQVGLEAVASVDWTDETIPSWRQAVITPWLRPAVFIQALRFRLKGTFRDGVTLLRFDRAFREGLMDYGIFRGRKPF